jgi:hypothetical protein
MELKEYLTEVIGDEVEIYKYQQSSKLPLFLTNEYEFDQCILHDKKCVFLNILSKRLVIDKIQKHFLKLKEYGIEYPVLVLGDLRAEQRKNLVANRLAFVVPGKQIYLPFICIDFSEKVTIVTKSTDKFTVATQVVYLYVLNQIKREVKTHQVAENLGISLISVNRAIRQLVSIGVIKESGLSTRKKYQRVPKHEYWEKGKNYLISPMQKRIYLSKKPQNVKLYLTEDSALAKYTMINEPDVVSYAIDKKNLDKIDKCDLLTDYQLDGVQYLTIEVWRYQPGLFAKTNIVDLFSLYAEYMEQDDPRVEIEFEELMEEALCED